MHQRRETGYTLKGATHSSPSPALSLSPPNHIGSASVIILIHVAQFTSVSPVADILEATLVETSNYRSIGNDNLSWTLVAIIHSKTGVQLTMKKHSS